MRLRDGVIAAIAACIMSACASNAKVGTAAVIATASAKTIAVGSTAPAVITSPSAAATSIVATSIVVTTTAEISVPATEPSVAPAPKRVTIDDLVASPRPIVLAHAGGENQHPHSTPYAFAESAKAGVDMLDFDVQLSKDGVLVVQHDDSVNRTTNGTGQIADMTYDQLAALDNAYWFTADCTCTGQPAAAYTLRGMRTGDKPSLSGYRPDDFIIPRFVDIVEAYPDLPLNIEIKGSGESAVAAAQELANILTVHDALDRAVVASFDDSIVQAFHAMAPSVEISPGLAASTAFILDGTPLPLNMRILQLPVEFQGIAVLTEATISASHAAGYVIWVWPDNRERWENQLGYDELLRMGMDGLNINFPADGVAAVKRFVGG